MIEFDAINRQAGEQHQTLLPVLLPGGRYQGREFIAGTIRGGDGDSFSLNTETGVWKDFSTDEAGSDLVALLAMQRGISQGEAASKLADMVGFCSHPDKQAGTTSKRKSYKKPDGVIPEPPGQITLPGLSKPTAMWPYRDERGNSLGFAVYRFDQPDGKKEFRPFLFENGNWYVKHPPTTPLYGLDRLAKDPKLPVLLVEGEKAADAGNSRGVNMAVVSWPGGCNGVKKVDLAPLKGRKLFLWADADEPGIKAMQEFSRLLQEQGITQDITLVSPPPDVEKGWDIADAVEAGWTRAQVEEWIDANGTKVPAKEEPADSNQQLRFLSAGELCNKAVRLIWQIKGLLPACSTAMVFGPSGSCKTFLALAWLLSIAARAIDSWADFPVKSHGPVFYLCGEGYAGIASRIKAWCFKNGVDPGDLQFFCSNRAVALLEQNSAQELMDVVDTMVAEHGAPAVIAIDTLNRNFGAGDENSTTDMTAFIQAVDQIRNRYGCTVLIVHHTGLADGNRARGSSALRAALDCEFKLSGQGNDVRVLECTKSKDSEPPDPMRLKPEMINLGEVDEDGQPVTSIVLSPTGKSNPRKTSELKGSKKVAMESLEAILDQQTGQAHIEGWRAEAFSRGISPSDTESSKRMAFKRAVSGLMDMGMVNTRDDFYWPLINGNSLLNAQPWE